MHTTVPWLWYSIVWCLMIGIKLVLLTCHYGDVDIGRWTKTHMFFPTVWLNLDTMMIKSWTGLWNFGIYELFCVDVMVYLAASLCTNWYCVAYSFILLLLAFIFRFELQYLEVREKQYDEKVYLDLYTVRYEGWIYFPFDNVPHVTTAEFKL